MGFKWIWQRKLNCFCIVFVRLPDKSLSIAWLTFASLLFGVFWVGLLLVRTEPLYVKFSTCPIYMYIHSATWLAFGVLFMCISFIFFHIQFKPKLFTVASFFFSMCSSLDDRRAKSSERSRSSCVDNIVRVMTLLWPFVVFVIAQSIATRNKMGEMMQPCLTPDLTEKQ